MRARLEWLHDALIEVDADGTILSAGAAIPERAAQLAATGVLYDLPEGEVLLPGFVDCHVHAPQWPQLGRALDVPLEDWLQRHTFPLEARYADLGFARAVYADMVAALLAQGTTTATYFGTIHVPATLALAETCLKLGQRAIIGKVAMDNSAECPDYYRDSDAGTAVGGSRAVIERIRALTPGRAPLVLPAITPRFLPSCSTELLTELGDLAAATGAHVQTHCSESLWEVEHGHSRFGRSDAEMLDHFGLLRSHTVLAHGNYTIADDRVLIRERGAAFTHCPLSNIYFAGAILPAREILDEGLRIGLGTDIAGGYSPSVLDNARSAIDVARMRDKPGAAIDVAEAFWMATAGGGEALGLKVGAFRPGFQFDALAVRTNALRYPGSDAPTDLFEQIVRRAKREDIRAVWVAGRQVVPVGA